MKLNPHVLGPTRTIETTDTLTMGTTSGWTDVAVAGPFICIEDTVFNTACVALHGSEWKPSSTKTYTAGTVVHKYLTTVKLTSGSVEACVYGDDNIQLGM